MRGLMLALVVGSTAYASSIDHELVAREIRRHLRDVQLCYEAAVEKDPTLSGRVSLQVELVGGRVSTAIVQQSTFLTTSPVPGCVAKTTAKWRFPSDPKSIRFTYPFVLANSTVNVDAAPSVTAGLSIDAIERVIERHLGEVRVCGGPSTPMTVTITADGNAEVGEAEGTTCLRSTIRRWAFPRSHAPTIFARVFP